jgi:hypothetical protein
MARFNGHSLPVRVRCVHQLKLSAGLPVRSAPWSTGCRLAGTSRHMSRRVSRTRECPSSQIPWAFGPDTNTVSICTPRLGLDSSSFFIYESGQGDHDQHADQSLVPCQSQMNRLQPSRLFSLSVQEGPAATPMTAMWYIRVI